MNVKNYKMVLDQIEKHPETWYQGSWHYCHTCETKHCFAGWAQLLAGENESRMNAFCDAVIFLDVTDEQANFLFNPNRTVGDFRWFLTRYQRDQERGVIS